MALRKPIPGFELSRTGSADELAAEVEQAINDLVAYSNSPLDGKGKRVRNVQRGISATDAVNVGQLRDAIVRGAANQVVQGPAKPGTPTSTATVHEYGVFSLDNIEVPNPPFTLHCLTASVNETTMSTDRGTLVGAIVGTNTTAAITNIGTAYDTGSYLLINNPTQNGTTTVSNDEIVYVSTRTGTNFTIARGKWGSSPVSHGTGLSVFPLELRHFSQTGKSNIGLEDQSTGQPTRMDMYLPARCVSACGVFASNSSGASGVDYQFLPVFSTAATATPLAPGLRTCMGQAYFLPLSTGTLGTGTNMCPVHIKVQDPASIRTIYAYADTAPTGADLILVAKMDPNTGTYTALETMTIAASANESYASGNEPRNRRMPYGINWNSLTPMFQDSKLQFDITQVGSTVAGGKLIVVFQT